VPDRPCPFEKTPTFQSAAEHRFGDSLLASAFGPLTVNPIERARGKSSSSMFEDFELSAKSYREGRTWVMANPDAKRMPRGVCLRRREAAARDVQVFCEAREKGNRSSTN